MKVELNKKTFLYTHPVFIIGTYDSEDKPNIMAVSWGGICCSEPPCISISLRKATYSYNSIMEKKAFTVNMPSEDFVKEADFCGSVSGRDYDKFTDLNLTAVKCDEVDAPYIKEFPVNMICRLKEYHELGLHTQFIGEILAVIADYNLLGKNDMPILEKVRPIIYDSGSSSYWGVGKKILKAYSTKPKK